MADEIKTEPMLPVPVTVIGGTGNGAIVQGTTGITPSGVPNVVIQVVSPLVAVFVRFMYAFLTTLSGAITANIFLHYGDLKTQVIIAAAGAAAGSVKDFATIFSGLEKKFPLASGSVGILLAASLLLPGCSANGPIRVIQYTHGSLAVAQDLEAQLCWGVADITKAPADHTHCTAPLAAVAKLTDARHQAIQRQFVVAFTLDTAATELVKAGGKPDLSLLLNAVAILQSLVLELDLNDRTAAQLSAQVTGARLKLGGQ